MDVNATDPASVALCNSLKWDILWFISDQKSYCCLCACYNSVIDFISQPQEQKVGRRQTQCSSTLCGCLCNWPSWHCPLQPFQMRYYVVHFDWKSCFFCVPAIKPEWILCHNHRKRKVIGCKHNVLVYYVNVCAPDPAGVVLWNPFIWDILWFILIENLDIFVCLP